MPSCKKVLILTGLIFQHFIPGQRTGKILPKLHQGWEAYPASSPADNFHCREAQWASQMLRAPFPPASSSKNFDRFSNWLLLSPCRSTTFSTLCAQPSEVHFSVLHRKKKIGSRFSRCVLRIIFSQPTCPSKCFAKQERKADDFLA